MKEGYRSVIGLEIHAQLASRSKIFCADPVDFGGMPNTRVSPVSLGHPGTLPTLNRECVMLAIKMGLASGCSIASECHFARKNYFYPDLPKGYQISQDNTPICFDGAQRIRLKDGSEKVIRIQRIHMEEDAGKNLHDQDMYDSLVDLNRASVGLIEIVTHPDIANAEEAMAYVAEIRKLVRYIEICDGNMEEGSLRCDANVSVMKVTDTKFGTRAEIKNVNSISNIGRAINYEIDRQIEVLESGGKVIQETRTWDAVGGRTLSLRDKESADDYRYFPEPDILPLHITDELLANIRATLPALPDALYKRYTEEYGLPDHDATLLTEQREYAAYFDAVLQHTQNHRMASNWLNGPVKTYLNEFALDITQFPLKPEAIAQLIHLVESGKVSFSVAKDSLWTLLLQQPEAEPEALAIANNLILNTDEGPIREAAIAILDANEAKVDQYNSGKDGLLGFFVGQVMRQTGGKADPKTINRIMVEELNKRRK